ncbi:Methionine import ATP-binding protein MetN [compost metagenome]
MTQEFINRDKVGDDGVRLAASVPRPEWAKLVRITFLGAKTYESVLSQVVRETGVNFAILQGTISTIKDVPYGKLTVSFAGENQAVDETLRLLQERDLDVEVIG